MDHIVIAVDDKDGRFVTLTRTNGAWQFAYDVGKRGGVLSAFVDRATTTLMEAWGMVVPQGQTHPQLPLPHNFASLPALTVTTRTITQIAEQGLVLDEANLATALPNVWALVYLPDGVRSDRWTVAHRMGGPLWSDKSMAFSVQLIGQQIRQAFDWAALAQPVGHASELMVRPAWSAARLFPDVYPMPQKTAQQVAAEASYQELRANRDPRLKRKKMQALAELERKLLPNSGISPEERAALSEARKAAYGAPWHGPIER